MDNIDFAILSSIQELGARYGVKPYDFIATLDHSHEATGMGVKFVIPAETSEPQGARVRKMLQAIGVNEDGILQGGEKVVIDALEQALHTAPKQRIKP